MATLQRRHTFLRLTAPYWGQNTGPQALMHLCIAQNAQVSGVAHQDITWYESGSSLNAPCGKNQD